MSANSSTVPGCWVARDSERRIIGIANREAQDRGFCSTIAKAAKEFPTAASIDWVAGEVARKEVFAEYLAQLDSVAKAAS